MWNVPNQCSVRIENPHTRRLVTRMHPCNGVIVCGGLGGTRCEFVAGPLESERVDISRFLASFVNSCIRRLLHAYNYTRIFSCGDDTTIHDLSTTSSNSQQEVYHACQ